MNWLRRRKVAPIPIPATPMMIAATLLDKVQQGEIENVVVFWKTVRGGFNNAHSTMLTSDMLMHEKGMQEMSLEHYRDC